MEIIGIHKILFHVFVNLVLSEQFLSFNRCATILCHVVILISNQSCVLHTSYVSCVDMNVTRVLCTYIMLIMHVFTSKIFSAANESNYII